MEQKSALMEDAGNMKWQQLLRIFKKITDGDPLPEKVKDQLDNLKTQAKNSHDLSVRQVEGISDRCNNYMNKEYGNTKRPEHLGHGPSEPKTK